MFINSIKRNGVSYRCLYIKAVKRFDDLYICDIQLDRKISIKVDSLVIDGIEYNRNGLLEYFISHEGIMDNICIARKKFERFENYYIYAFIPTKIDLDFREIITIERKPFDATHGLSVREVCDTFIAFQYYTGLPCMSLFNITVRMLVSLNYELQLSCLDGYNVAIRVIDRDRYNALVARYKMFRG